MLSAEKAKLKSTWLNTNSHTHNEIRANKKLTQTLGVNTSLKIKFNISLIFPEGETREFIADFKKSWFTVSQMLVRAINGRIKNRPSLIPGHAPSLTRSKKQKRLPII